MTSSIIELSAELFLPNPDFKVLNDDNDHIEVELLLEQLTPETQLDRALVDIHKYLNPIEGIPISQFQILAPEFEKELFDGPHVHDRYERPSVDKNPENGAKLGSPGPGPLMRPNSLICKEHLTEDNHFEVIPKYAN